MMTVEIYRYADTWCFTDEKRGLIHEPFVLGTPEIVDYMIESLPSQNTENKYRIIFSSEMFPNCKTHLKRDKNEHGGAWYALQAEQKDELRGWLCPATLKFFADFPECIFFHLESMSGQGTPRAQK
jgi:hypothetical protein